MRRIGVLMNIGADDPEAPALVGAFSQGLAELGWIIGRNARIDYRWYQGNPEAARAYAAELLTLTPDIILASGTPGTIAVKQLTRTVPIVFTRVGDAVGSGQWRTATSTFPTSLTDGFIAKPIIHRIRYR